MKVAYLFLCLQLALFSKPASAGWQVVTGDVIQIASYSRTSAVLIVIVNQPSGQTPSGCSLGHFAIDPSMPEDRVQHMMSMLMVAKMAGQSVQLTYDDAATCVSYSPSYEVPRIVRLII